jgi:hypothetical protein
LLIRGRMLRGRGICMGYGGGRMRRLDVFVTDNQDMGL